MAIRFKPRLARSGRGLAALLTLTTIGAWSFSGQAFSDQTLKSVRQPVQVENKIPLNARTAKPGDAFEGVLTDNYHFGAHTLPAGTVLRGTVQSAQRSRPLGRPGYIRLNVQEATFPSGSSHTFTGTNGHPGLETHKIKDEEALTFGQIILVNLPLLAASTGTSIPLALTTDLSKGSIFAIAMGARLGTGVLLEGTPRERRWHDRRHHLWPTRIGHGLLRGTGLVALYDFLWPGPNPDLALGTKVPLRFDKDELNSLFASDSAVNIPTGENPAAALP